MPHIILVKKIKADGQPCNKCQQVVDRLLAEGLMDRIDSVVIADARNPNSEGMRLAQRHGVSRAPFFLVTDAVGDIEVHTVFLRFLNKVLKKPRNRRDQIMELEELADSLEFI